jgi:hypothetical protein
MKLSHLTTVLGLGLLAILAVYYMSSTDARNDLDRRIEACQQVGRVASDCPTLVPSIEVCHEEDCSDIRGRWGFFHDHGVWYLREAPETVIRPQGSGS